MSKERPLETIDHESVTLRRKQGKLDKAFVRLQSNFSSYSLSVTDEENLSAALEVVKFGRDIFSENFTMMNFEGRDYMVKFETPVTLGVDLMRSISSRCAMKRVIPIDIEFVAKAKLSHLEGELSMISAQTERGRQKKLTKTISYIKDAIEAIKILEEQVGFLDQGIVCVEDVDEAPFKILGRLSEVQYLKSLSATSADLIKYINDLKLDIKFNSISAIKWDQQLIPDDKSSHVLSSAKGDIFGPSHKSNDEVQLSIAEHAGMLAIFGDFDFNPRNFLLSSKTGKVVHIDQSPLVNGFFCDDEILRQYSRVFGSSLTKDFIQVHLAGTDRDPAHFQVERVVKSDSNIRRHINTFLVDYKIDDMISLLDSIEKRVNSNPQIKQQFIHFVDTLQRAIELGGDDSSLNSYRDHVFDSQGQVAAARVEMQIEKLKLNTLEAKAEYGPLITLAKKIAIRDESSNEIEEMEKLEKLYLERKGEISFIRSKVDEVLHVKCSDEVAKTGLGKIFDSFDVESLKSCQYSLLKEGEALDHEIEMQSKERTFATPGSGFKRSPNSAFSIARQEGSGAGATRVVTDSRGQPSISISGAGVKLDGDEARVKGLKK